MLYASLLKPLDQIEIMFDLHDDDIPHTFPIRVKNLKREKLYFYLMERNMPTTALYYRMIDEIDASKYPTSYAISSEILNLPVHQDTTNEDIFSLWPGFNTTLKHARVNPVVNTTNQKPLLKK